MKYVRPILFFASPVFDHNDRVPSGGGGGGSGLPPELEGKTPAEIANYYQERERRLRAEMAQNPSVPADVPPSVPPSPTNTEFWNDPTGATRKIVEARAFTKEEWDRQAAAVRPSLVWAAKEQCRQKHPDFDRVKDEVDQIMKLVPDWQHADPNMWETSYIYAKGRAYDRLSTEDRTRPVVVSEPVNPGSTPPQPLEDLTKVTGPGLKPHQTAAYVADHLGVSHEQYRKAQIELNGEGKLPLTVDNRGRR